MTVDLTPEQVDILLLALDDADYRYLRAIDAAAQRQDQFEMNILRQKRTEIVGLKIILKRKRTP